MRTALHAGLRTAGNAKRIANEMGYAGKQGRPETAKHETKVKGNDTGARSVDEDADVGRESCEGQGGFGPFLEGLEWGEERMTPDVWTGA
jgi:hypothetical protein